MVIVIKQRSQLYGAVGIAERLGTTLERAKRIQESLLNLTLAIVLQVLLLIAINCMILEMRW